MSDVRTARLVSPADCHAAASLFAEIWGTTIEAPVAPELLFALAVSGNYVAGAWADEELVGAAMGFFGRDQHGPHLHSHIAGVAPTAQNRGVGFALKTHQRAWALDHGLTEVRWTFDPLVRRNAWFNLTRLGAVGVGYVENYYGVLGDAINAGDATDRMIVSWDLTTAPAPPPARDDDRFCATPEDVVALRREAPDEARRWRHEQREILNKAFADGYRAVGADADGGIRLSRP